MSEYIGRWNGRMTDSHGFKRGPDGRVTSNLRGTPKVGGNKGVMRIVREAKLSEANARNRNTNAVKRVCGHVHGIDVGCGGRDTPCRVHH